LEAKSEYRPLKGIQRCYPILVIIAIGPAPRNSNSPRYYVLERLGQSQPCREFGEAIRRPAHKRETQAPRGNNLSAYKEQPRDAACPDQDQSRHRRPMLGRRAGAEMNGMGGQSVRLRLLIRPSATEWGYLHTGPLAGPHSAARTNLASTPEPSFAPQAPCRQRSGTLGATHSLHLETAGETESAWKMPSYSV